MRFIFGVIVGIAVTVGAAYVHDQNVPTVSLTDPTARRVVNWNVVSAISSERIAAASDWLQSMIGR